MTDISKTAAAAYNLQKVLISLGWEPELDNESVGFYIDPGTAHAPLSSIYAAISPEAEQLVIYFNLGLAARPEHRVEAARFITHANWGLMIGNFEMDFSDGHVRFKSSLDFSGVDLTESLIRNAIMPALTAVDVYASALIEVISGRKDAAAAIADVEER